MDNFGNVLSVLELLKDILVGFAWPAALVFLLFYFRAEARHIFRTLAHRLGDTSHLELPGGIKAVFSARPQDTAKRLAEDVLSEIAPSVATEDREQVRKKIQAVIYSEEARNAVLFLVASQGIVSRQRAHSIIAGLDPSIAPDDVDRAIQVLKESSFITEDNSKLTITPKGERVIQSKRLQGEG